ncbi:Hypothetical protein DHA2_137712 [Giardia duodenalis]|uniref:MSP domain-containing protein n=1 Tax=Giardia intestinalis TaxID=5741 RepID=V6TCJ1_GIAIN|nr:Hypothetical protein DHA2_137712 [Giardia intestinalis]
MVDLPTEVVFDATPYGITAERPLFLMNDSDGPMGLTFVTDGPFSVSPTSVSLPPMISKQLTLTCHPTNVGVNRGTLHVSLNKALYKSVALICSSYSAEFKLERTVLDNFPKTLVTHTATSHVDLMNTSDVVTTFKVKAYPCPQNGEDPDFHELLLPFSVFPLSGTIYPSSKCTFTVTFQPSVSGPHDTTAWIECTGSKERQPLRMRALAVGPEVEFDCDELRFRAVVVGASARGELTLTNYSEIEVEFHLMPTEEHDPSYILQYSCISGVIPPRSHINIELTFTPHSIKEYIIPSLWSILGLSKCLVIEIKATSVAPNVEMKVFSDSLTETHLRVLIADKRLRRRIVDEANGRRGVYYSDEHSDVEHMSWLTKEFLAVNEIDKDRIIDFGLVAFSFSSSKDLRVRNLSQLECDFTLKIEPSRWVFDHEGQGNSDTKQEMLLACSDFSVNPPHLRLKPGADAHVSLTILPKRRAGFYKDIDLNLYHASSQRPLQTIQIIGSIINPKFEIDPTVINIAEGFVGYRHTFNVKIKNVASVIGNWSFPVQDVLDNCLITCSKASGVLLPGAEESLECGIIPRSQGHLVIPVAFTSDAFEKQTLSCMVQYSARGPRVEAGGPLEFTRPNNKESYVRVLDVVHLPLTLKNVGLTSARCRVIPEKHGSFFSIEKEFSDKLVAPGEETSIPITFYTTEAGTYRENLLVYVTLANASCSLSEDTIKATSSVIKVPMYASAKGTNLLCPHQDLNKEPNVDCGTWFVTEELQYSIVIQNHGAFAQNCTWVYIGNPGVKKGQGNTHYLKFEQDRVQLQPGAFHTFKLKGRVPSVITNGREIYQLKSNVPGKETKVAFQVTFCYSFINAEVAASEMVLPLNEGLQTASLYHERCEPLSLGKYSFLERHLVLVCKGQSPGSAPLVQVTRRPIESSLTITDVSESIAGSVVDRPSTRVSNKKQRPSLLNFIYEEFPVIASPDYFIERADVTSQFLGADNIPFNNDPPVPLAKFVSPDGYYYVRHELTKFIKLVNTSSLPGKMQILVQAPFRVRVIAKDDEHVCHYIHDTLALEAGLADRVDDPGYCGDFISATLDTSPSPCATEQCLDGAPVPCPPNNGDEEPTISDASNHAVDELDEDASALVPANVSSPFRQALGLQKGTSEDSEIPIQPTDPCSVTFGGPVHFPAFAQTVSIDLKGNSEEFCIVEISVDTDYVRSDSTPKFVDSTLVIRLLPPGQLPISVPTVAVPLKLSAFFPSLEFRSCSLATLKEHNLDMYSAYSALSNQASKHDLPLDNSSTDPEKGIIDFGMANVGTTITQIILCKNISRFPVRFQWLLQMAQGSDKFKYDITPLGVDGNSGLLPGHLAKFNVSFVGQTNEICTDQCRMICSIDGGESYSYGLRAGTSNLEADVRPSYINYGDITFSSEQTSTISITNKSPMKTTVVISIPYECRPFISKLSNAPLQVLTSPAAVSDFSYELNGHSVLDIPLSVRPLIPGPLYIPLSIKIGYLERLILPITAKAYIERSLLVSGGSLLAETHTQVSNTLPPMEYLFPWDNNASASPLSELLPYNAFLIAASLYIRHVEVDAVGLRCLAEDSASSEANAASTSIQLRSPCSTQLISTLHKKIGPDGSLEIYGVRYEPKGTETITSEGFLASLHKDYVLNSVASDLCINFLEFYRYYGTFPIIGAEDIIEAASRSAHNAVRPSEKKMSIARTRLLSPSVAHRLSATNQAKKETPGTTLFLDGASMVSQASSVTRAPTSSKQPIHLNDGQYHHLREKLSTNYLCNKFVLFNVAVSLPPVIRGTKTSQTITIYNKGSTPMHLSFDKRFMLPAGVSVEPEKVSRLPSGESITLTIMYTANHKAVLGNYVFVIPIEFKQSIIGFLTCNVSVTLPTIRPVNLSACSSNFVALPIKESDAYVLNFGEVLYGQAKMFNLRLENPTAVQAAYTFELLSGVVGLLKEGKEKGLSVEAPLLGTDPNIFTLITAEDTALQNYGSLAPKTSDLLLDIVFKPFDYFPDSTDRIYFRGSLVFHVKMGGINGNSSKVTVHFVGLGTHPAVRLSKQIVEFLPIYPKELPGSFEMVELRNDSDETYELYVKEFDKFNHVEQLLYSSLARNCGKMLVFDRKTTIQPALRSSDGTQGDPSNNSVYRFAGSYTPAAYGANSPSVLSLLGKPNALSLLAANEQPTSDAVEPMLTQTEARTRKPTKILSTLDNKQARPPTYSHLLSEVPAPGDGLGPITKKLLLELGLARLVAWFEQCYLPPEATETHEPDVSVGKAVSKSRGASGRSDKPDPAHHTSSVISTDTQGASRNVASAAKSEAADKSVELPVSRVDACELPAEDETIQYLDVPVSQEDFAYDLCPIELLTQKYARIAPSVIKGRSYRIASNDTCLSNLPFLVYVIHGAPLAGKTTLANKISSFYNRPREAVDALSKGVQMPILSLENLLENSKAYKDILVRVSQWEDASKKPPESGGKNVPKKKTEEAAPATDPMKEPDYLDALADSLYTSIVETFGARTTSLEGITADGGGTSYTHSLTGLIFDSLTCSAVRDVGDAIIVIAKASVKHFMKPIFYSAQNVSSRLLFHTIVLDCSPVDSRRRAMEILVNDYKSAEMGVPVQDETEPAETRKAETKISMVRLALSGAKKQYDKELSLYSKEPKEASLSPRQKIPALSDSDLGPAATTVTDAVANGDEQGPGASAATYVTPFYDTVFVVDDPHGAAHQMYLKSVPLINSALHAIKELVTLAHKTSIDTYRSSSRSMDSFSPEEASYKKALDTLKQAQEALSQAKKADQKRLQQAVDEATEVVAELEKALPPHPVTKINEENMFLVTYMDTTTSNRIDPTSTLEEILRRIRKAYTCYTSILQKKLTNLATYSSAQSISGQGTFTSFLHVQTSDDLYVIETIQRILDVIFDAADYKQESFSGIASDESDMPEPERTMAAADAGADVESIAPAVESLEATDRKKSRTSKTPIQVLNKMLQKYARSPAFATLKHVTGAIMNKEFMSPKVMLECLYDAAVFQYEHEQTFKRIARVLPANSSTIYSFQDAQKQVQTICAEIKDLQASLSSKGANAKQLSQSLAEKQAAKDNAETNIRTLFSGVDFPGEMGSTRWILKPHSSLRVGFRFVSNSILTTKLRVHFGVRGCSTVFPLVFVCKCDFPHIIEQLNVIFTARTATKNGKSLTPLPDGMSTAMLTASGTQPGPDESSAAAEVSQTPNFNDSDQKGEPIAIAQRPAEVSVKPRPGEPVALFGFGYLRSGLHRPEFFSMSSAFSNPYAASEAPLDVMPGTKQRPSTKVRSRPSSSISALPKDEGQNQGDKPEASPSCLLTKLDTLTHQRACKFIADTICKFTPQHMEVLSIINDSYFPVTVAFIFDSMLHGLAELTHANSSRGTEINFSSDEVVSVVKEGLQKVFSSTDPTLSLQDLLFDGSLQTSKSGTKQQGKPGTKGAPVADVEPVFVVYPYRLTLQPGERSAIYITCFPPEDKSYKETLFIGVNGNPSYLAIGFSCAGQTPRIEYSLSECAEDLLPCSNISKDVDDLAANSTRYLANGYKLDAKDIVSGSKNASKAPTKGKDPAHENLYQLNNLLVPRVPTSTTESLEIPIENTSQLPLMVEYCPMHTELSMLTAVTQVVNYPEYLVKSSVKTTKYPRSTRIADQQYSWRVNNSLLINNARFYLGPGERKVLNVEYSSPTEARIVMPGKLLVRQHVGGLKNVPENDVLVDKSRTSGPRLPTLDALGRAFLDPVVEHALNIICESHKVDVFTTIVGISESPDRIPSAVQSGESAFDTTKPNNNLNLGIVRALVYFKAELMLVNNGPYQVGYKIVVSKSFKDVIFLIEDSDSREKAERGKKQESSASAQTRPIDPDMYKLVTIQSGTLGVDESNRPSSRPNPLQKQGKGASESSTSKVRISLIFRAPEARIYEKVPILQVTFFEPLTNLMLARNNVNLTAEAVFSQAKIQPERNIVFGEHPHGKVVSKTISIRNEGHFPFLLYIEPLEQVIKRWLLFGEASPFSDHAKKATNFELDASALRQFGVHLETVHELYRLCVENGLIRPSTEQKAQSKSVEKRSSAATTINLASIAALRSGPFIIQPSLLHLAPQESREVTVTFTSQANGNWRDYFIIDYTNKPPDYFGGSALTETFLASLLASLNDSAKTAPSILQTYISKNEDVQQRLAKLQYYVMNLPLLRYSLSAISIIPGIVTSNYSNIFEEQALSNQLPANPSMLVGGPTFSPISKIFCLGPCVIGSELSERIKVTNPYSVPCTVAILLNFDQTRMTPQALDGVISERCGETSTQIVNFVSANLKKNAKRESATPSSQERSSQQVPKPPKPSGDKKDTTLVTNDNEAWSLENDFFRLLPNESTYVTLKYFPSAQVVSRCQVICVVVDHHFAVVDLIKNNLPGIFGLAQLQSGGSKQPTGKGMPPQDHVILQQLEDGLQEQDVARRRFSFIAEATGVLPEVSFSPQFVNLGKITVGASEMDLPTHPISILNTGRVSASYAIVISSQDIRHADCFVILQSQGRGSSDPVIEDGEEIHVKEPIPQGRLFTGLVVLPASTKNYFTIAPNTAALAKFPNGEVITATLTLKVMTSSVDYNVAEIPLQCIAISSKLNAIEGRFISTAIQNMYKETTALLFGTFGNPKAEQLTETILSHLSDSKAYEQLRQNQISTYGDVHFNQAISNRANVYLKDLPLNLAGSEEEKFGETSLPSTEPSNARPKSRPSQSSSMSVSSPPPIPQYMTTLTSAIYNTEVILQNTSTNHIRFEFNIDLCRKLGVIAHPSTGHIHAGAKKTIILRLTCPGNADEFASLFSVPGGKAAPLKAKKMPSKYGQTVLFGTPLICRYYPIMFQPGRRVNDWDNAQTTISYVTNASGVAVRTETVCPEPEYQVYLDEDEVRSLLEEMVSSRDLTDGLPRTGKGPSQASTKAAHPADRQALLQKVLSDIHAPDNRIALASSFLELNLFGFAGDFSVKCFSSSSTGDLEPLTLKADGVNGDSLLEFPMVGTPILQKSAAAFYLLNDSQTSPVVMFNSMATSQPESPYLVEPVLDGKTEIAMVPARPDLLASLVREYYPTLPEIPSISGLMAKVGIGAKTQIDKNALNALQTALTSSNPNINRYLIRYNISYEPRFPGAHNEVFASTAGNISLSLSAMAILPVCHLECNSNNVYLQTMRPGSMKTPQSFANLICSNPKSVKVLEILGQGVGITITNHITVLNCINQPYDVTLQRLPESNSSIVSTFGAGGRVSPGETSIIRFDYTPTRESTRAGVEEGFFILRIPQHDVTLPLLVVGRPTEPEVILSTNKLSFNPILVGDCATKEVSLTNTEKYPMNYKIRLAQPAKNMVDDDSANASFQCTITPTAGILQPLSTTSILFTVKPTCEGRINQLIKIVMPRRSVPLSLNVKYESFNAKHLLELLPDTPVGLPHQLGSHSELNFETVFVSDYRSRTLRLSNIGSHTIGYTCILSLKRHNSTARRDEVEFKRAKSCLEYEVETSDGDKEANATSKQTIKPGDHVFITLKFQPTLELRLTKDFGLTFTVSVEGCGSQELQLLGTGLKPGLHTETTRLDYGAVLNSLRHDKYAPRVISFVNRDTQPLTMEYFLGTNDFFIDTPPLSEPLRVGRTHDVAIKFIPGYAGKFKDMLTVMVNGLYKLRYPLTGQGIDCSFALHDVLSGSLINSYSNLSTSHALTVINLGSTSLSSPPIIKAVNIKNTTSATMHARVAVNDVSSDEVPKGLFLAIVPTEQYHDYFNKCMDMLDNWSNRNTKQIYLTGLPKESEILPNQLCTIMIMHSPVSRTPQFQISASISIEDSIIFDSIISIKGAVLGASAKLINQNIEMPPCIINSFVSRNFFIENTGDTELRYTISVPPKGLVKKSLLELFEKGVVTISPVSGLIPVGTNATITVKFSPQQVCRHFIPSIPVECTMEGKMIIVGEATLRCVCLDKASMEAAPNAQEVHMSCNARESTFTILHVDNNTDSVFVVRSILDGPDARQFQVPERLSIPPGGMDFKVMYSPLATADLHRADLYIAGADGGASIWALHGTVGQPMDEAVITNMQEADYNDLIGKSGASVAIVGKDKGKQTSVAGVPQGLPQSFIDTLTKAQRTICTGVEATCYRYTTFSFPLRNWEKRMQRFTVDVQFLDSSLSTFCQLNYPEIVDAPAIGAVRNIELGFMPFISGKLFAGTLSFVAHETNEKLIYRFVFESGGAPVVGRAALETTVRDPVEKLITIPNPLLSNKTISSLTLTTTTDRDDLTITPETVTFNNKTSTYSFKVKFNPYVPFDSGAINTKVSFGVSTILSGVEKSELCRVDYTLELMCYIPRPSSPMKVQADVGTTLPFTITLVNNLRPKPTEKIVYALGLTEMHDIAGINELISKKTASGTVSTKTREAVLGIVDGKAIQNNLACFGLTSAEVTASYGQPFTVSLKFSPQSFGEYSASLVVYNKQGGFWVVPLIGKCTRPPASGTITVTK